jgi:hypothetical protein
MAVHDNLTYGNHAANWLVKLARHHSKQNGQYAALGGTAKYVAEAGTDCFRSIHGQLGHVAGAALC